MSMVDLSMHSYNYCYFEHCNYAVCFNGRSMKHLLKTMVATVVALSFTGCGMVSQGITSEETYLDRAESATGVDKSQLTLDKDSISGSLDAVNFMFMTSKVTAISATLAQLYLLSMSHQLCALIFKRWL